MGKPDALGIRAALALKAWLAGLGDDDRALLDECAAEVAPTAAESLDSGGQRETPSKHETIADPKTTDSDLLDARAHVNGLTGRQFTAAYAKAVRREACALAGRFCARRFARPLDESLGARLRQPAPWMRDPQARTRRRGQRSLSPLSHLVVLLDDADELMAGHALSRLEIAMVSLVLGYYPKRIRLQPRLGDLRGDVARVVSAQEEAAGQAQARHSRPSSQWMPTGNVAGDRADLVVTKGMLVTKHCRACGSPTDEAAIECPGGPSTRGAHCGGRVFYWATWRRWDLSRGPRKRPRTRA